MKLFYRERKEAVDRCRETVGERDRQKDRVNKLFQSENTNCKKKIGVFCFFKKGRNKIKQGEIRKQILNWQD